MSGIQLAVFGGAHLGEFFKGRVKGGFRIKAHVIGYFQNDKVPLPGIYYLGPGLFYPVFIDEVIKPEDTRNRLIRGFKMLENKVDKLPKKKHGNIPL